MALQFTICLKRIATFGTGKLLLSCVGLYASLQIITLAECFVTYRAGKWFLLCGFFVTLQMTTLAECIVTYGTGKWSLSCVNIFMNCQIGIILKCSVTLVVIIFSMLLEVKNFLTSNCNTVINTNFFKSEKERK